MPPINIGLAAHQWWEEKKEKVALRIWMRLQKDHPWRALLEAEPAPLNTVFPTLHWLLSLPSQTQSLVPPSRPAFQIQAAGVGGSVTIQVWVRSETAM